MKCYAIRVLVCIAMVGCSSSDGDGPGAGSTDGATTDVSDDLGQADNEIVDPGLDTPAPGDGEEADAEGDTGGPEIRSPQKGCDDQDFLLPPGWTSLRVEPQDVSMTVSADSTAVVDYQVVATLTGGAEKVVEDSLFLVNNSGIGQLNGDGQFTSFPERGGVVTIQAMAGGGCVQTSLTVITVFEKVMAGVEPKLPEWFAKSDEPGVNPASPHLVYPVAGAAWPSNLPPMVMQWKYAFGGASSVFRLDFVAPYARVHVYGDHSSWKHAAEKYAAPVPAEAWSRIWKLLGGSPHQVSVVAGVNVGNGLATGLLRSAPITVHFTPDQFGGAVYYWSTLKGGIRVLDLAAETPTVESIPIEGGCHGCHAASPDGETIAVSYVTKKINGQPAPKGSSKWTMAIQNVEDGKSAAWVHPDAAEFLAKDGTLYPAFSSAYWTETQKHIVVTHGLLKTTSTPIIDRRLFSVDLLNGDVNQLTNEDQGLGDHQFFPALSRNGLFLVFADAKKSKVIATIGEAQLWRMDYSAGKGGVPQPLLGANDPELIQYYPAITPDDENVIFNRAKADTSQCPVQSGKGGPSSGGSYDNCFAELWIVPQGGGESIRLDAANGSVEAMYANSWPSMSDKVSGSYYWVAFSTRRPYGFILSPEAFEEGNGGLKGKGVMPQIWVAAVDPQKIAAGEDPSFAPLWLPGQDMDSGNHIGQWSVR